MALVVSLNESVKTLAFRFDTFQKTIDENLSSKDIKKSVKNWKADHMRV